MALPLGAVLCFLDLIGARAFVRGEVRYHMFRHNAFVLMDSFRLHYKQPFMGH